MRFVFTLVVLGLFLISGCAGSERVAAVIVNPCEQAITVQTYDIAEIPTPDSDGDFPDEMRRRVRIPAGSERRVDAAFTDSSDGGTWNVLVEESDIAVPVQSDGFKNGDRIELPDTACPEADS